jgi:integrase
MSDKYLTTPATASTTKEAHTGPHAIIRHGSVNIPIYAGITGGKTRYTIAFHLNGKRQRRMFTDLDKAKREAKLAAEKIQRGLAANNDLSTRDREIFHAARKMLAPLNVPMLAALEEYVRARMILKELPLVTAAQEFMRQNDGVKLGVTVPEVCAEMVAAKSQDSVSEGYVKQLKWDLRAFSKEFPGPILHVKSEEIDRWLRGLGYAVTSRNNMLQSVKGLFKFARMRNYLPKTEITEASRITKLKVPAKDNEIYTPAQFEKLLRAAPSSMIPLLAIRGFSGLRSAELMRLDWSAVNLDRRIIELRATQAKTAARRIVPISDNLAAWIAPFVAEGLIIPDPDVRNRASRLAKKIGIGWPKNVLRHSYISYRVALTGDVPRTALESGNSPDIIFRHYREVVDEDAAKAWFGIMPPVVWPPKELRIETQENAG